MEYITEKLKELSWNDNWKDYVLYGKEQKSIVITRISQISTLPTKPMPARSLFDLVEFMEGIEKKMSVYEAFLKGIEEMFSQNRYGFGFKELTRLKKEELKNLKNGIYIETLAEYISAASRGYIKWHDYNERKKKNMSTKQKRLYAWSKVSQFTSIPIIIELLPLIFLLIAEKNIPDIFEIVLWITLPALGVLTIISSICEGKLVEIENCNKLNI